MTTRTATTALMGARRAAMRQHVAASSVPLAVSARSAQGPWNEAGAWASAANKVGVQPRRESTILTQVQRDGGARYLR